MKFIWTCIFFVCCTGCLSVQQFQQQHKKKTVDAPLQQSPDSWSLDDCDNIMHYYTGLNKRGLKLLYNPGSRSAEKILIKAMPLNKHTISARMRKQAINRRLSTEEFHRRLQVELADYTNWTMDSTLTKIIHKSSIGDTLLNEITFKLRFQNISEPHSSIEVFRAEEAFFLENLNGEFTRVIALGGLDADDYFVLVSDLTQEFTFSLLTDAGKKLTYDEKTYNQFKLIFNGLQSNPIVVEW